MGKGYSRFTVIEGGNKPIPGTRRKRKGDAIMCRCRTCQVDIGVSSSVWIKVKLGLMERAGRPEGGTDAWVCAMCLARGKVTQLL